MQQSLPVKMQRPSSNCTRAICVCKFSLSLGAIQHLIFSFSTQLFGLLVAVHSFQCLFQELFLLGFTENLLLFSHHLYLCNLNLPDYQQNIYPLHTANYSNLFCQVFHYLLAL